MLLRRRRVEPVHVPKPSRGKRLRPIQTEEYELLGMGRN
jgi:hypothetical protein